MQKHNILVVDDEKNILKVVSATLKKENYAVDTAQSSEEAIERFNKNGYDLVISDLKLPGKSGVELLEYIDSKNSDVPVIVITAFGTIENAVEAMKKGAFNYLTKPVNPDELLTVVREALEKFELKRENRALKSELRQKYTYRTIFGKSAAMQEVFDTVGWCRRPRTSSSSAGGTGKSSSPGRSITTRTGRAGLRRRRCCLRRRSWKASFSVRRTPSPGRMRKSPACSSTLTGELFLDRSATGPQPRKDLRFLRAEILVEGAGSSRRAHRRRHEPRSAQGGEGGPVPRGPLLPAQRHDQMPPLGNADDIPFSPTTSLKR
jgi:FixJ family two-component response regulator